MSQIRCRWLGCLVLALEACGARSELGSVAYDVATPTATGGTVPHSSTGGTLSTGGTMGTGGYATAITTNPSNPGCSDGTREGFIDQAAYPKIAACSGGFSVPGVDVPRGPTCGRLSGNASQNPNGQGCSADDLCAAGFHMCQGAVEVALDSNTGCDGATVDDLSFFATRQGSNGCGVCTLGTLTDPSVCNGETCASDCAQSTNTANDVFGCGAIGALTGDLCGVLNRFSHDLCSALPGTPWSCGGDDYYEARWVTKSGPEAGGVLCCAD